MFFWKISKDIIKYETIESIFQKFPNQTYKATNIQREWYVYPQFY